MELADTEIASVDAGEIAFVLNAMADLLAKFRSSDLALQDALSTLAARARSTPEMNDLQHLDLLTQTHGDLANLLPALASALCGERVDREALRSTLSLRSLQDTLLDRTESIDTAEKPGELSLF